MQRQQVPSLRSASVQPNAVCNHEFTARQLTLQPQFAEKESNSIISGNTSRELRRSINTSVHRGAGNTRWNIGWTFDSRRNLSGCAIENVQAGVEVDYHLPLWPEQLYVSNRVLAEQWSQYSDALRAHHCKHGRVGIDASIEVKSSLQLLRPRGSCEQMEVDADALARSIIGKYKEIESRFEPPVLDSFISR